MEPLNVLYWSKCCSAIYISCFREAWLTEQKVIVFQHTPETLTAGAELIQICPTEKINLIWKKKSQNFMKFHMYACLISLYCCRSVEIKVRNTVVHVGYCTLSSDDWKFIFHLSGFPFVHLVREILHYNVFSEKILRAFVYDAALDPPIVIFVKEEQCFSWVLVMDGSINFCHRCWQIKAAEI